MNDNRKAPTPALPRKREREHTPLLSGEGGALVRARRVGAASIGISRSHLNFEIPDRSALRTVRNDNNQTEDTP
jgi:hypothetical protein